jgi:hypothetical protein
MNYDISSSLASPLCAAGRADRLRNGIGNGYDRVRVPVDDLAREIDKTLAPPLAGIALASPRCPVVQLGLERRVSFRVSRSGVGEGR